MNGTEEIEANKSSCLSYDFLALHNSHLRHSYSTENIFWNKSLYDSISSDYFN